ncbi:M14 family metallopeptidase [Shewanella oncorhynchi]|uniref:M14 family metallopeptidase n=1 Tax=Shewanella TaxID=22 RepID=UPI001039FD73|nr:M14 family metallopeptidase [Shewanella sp. ISTPL2]
MKKLPFELPFELDTLQQLIDTHHLKLDYQILADIPFRQEHFPLYSVELGGTDTPCPTVLFVGGVHGVERIGSQVILALLNSLLQRLVWDKHLQQMLTGLRLAFVPVVNPVGLFMGTRGNGNQVDLMRNAPIESREKVSFMVGGQRISSRLPWYRGIGGMELETAGLVAYVQQLLSRSTSLISLDAHSGFGLSDHIWFPYAHTRTAFENANYIFHLKQLFEQSYPHHGHYRLAPQSQFYRTHGDIWDYLYRQHQVADPSAQVPFLPLTLEMGSWAWIKKNPRQIFNFAGFFNPQKTHRHHRILRRHTVLMQFMMEAAYAQSLEQLTPERLAELTECARHYWYWESQS